MTTIAVPANASQTDVSVHLQRQIDPDPIPVALLRPPWVIILESSGVLQPTPPVGLSYIAAVLREAGHQVQVIDAAW